MAKRGKRGRFSPLQPSIRARPKVKRREGSGGKRGLGTKFAGTEWAVAVLATLVVVSLHLVRLAKAGALWRDEVSTVYLATLPSLGDVWRWFPYDHCPPLIHLVIRGWWALGAAGTDFSLRVLGLLIGLLLPAAYWFASRTMRHGLPLLSLALAAVNAVVITTGDSFRGYGLGGALVVLMLALMWRQVQDPTWANGTLAAAAAILSVQGLYQNAFFVFGACCGGIAVCAMRRRFRSALGVLGVGLTAATSLLPYLPVLRQAQERYLLEKTGFDFGLALQPLSVAFGFPFRPFIWVWISLFALSMGVAAVSTWRNGGQGEGARDQQLPLFAATALLAGTACFLVFLKVAALPTQYFYYLPLLTFIAACLDAILPDCSSFARRAVLVFSAVTVIAAIPSGLPILETRQTNADLVAQRLAKDAGARDYVVAYPWYNGISFARYYRGAAPWTTLPQLADHDLHRYDLLKTEMQKRDPIKPQLDEIASTLRSGHRVWLVGPLPIRDETPPHINPAPYNPWGWLDEPYSIIWGLQAGNFVARHSQQQRLVISPGKEMENLALVLVTGWKE